MTKVRISTRAAEELRSERVYLSKFSKQAAEQFVLQMRAARRTLSEYPEAGVQIASSSEVRSLVTPPYVLEYEVQGSEIVVLLIRHGRQGKTVMPMDSDDFPPE